ncbi:radical SAM protein [Candidatus Eisenbacteria bacterium]|uniref:Radical SAM protein n=1 Tax=Eiseniibacteriota bacterium TaxID=2212470 RepID=A0ABV6YPX0_UNCEI
MVMTIAFGPVPSRRLGRSIGVNNIPAKTCSYSCVYCQVGNTVNMGIERKEFYETAAIFEAVERKVREAIARSEPVDFLTFVSDGEPTLDIHLGKTIAALKPLGVKIGVISNASLIWQSEVRVALQKADWVSLKIDAVSQAVWRRINRPHRSLSLDRILEGISLFSATHQGEWTTETMLVRGVNDDDLEVEKVARFISGLNPARSYLSIPIRPPAVKSVKSPEEEAINRAYQIFREKSIDVEYLIGYEGNAFASTGEAVSDLLGITSVHPMREDAVDRLLSRSGAGWSLVDKLIAEGSLVKVEYGDATFFVRRLPG